LAEAAFRLICPDDDAFIQQIAGWYLLEWKIPLDKTVQKLKAVAADNSQFQILMTLNNKPIAAAGLYHHVGLLDKEPRFKIHANWLALVYTIPEMRGQGFGGAICNHVVNRAKELGVSEIHLFTDTAERLYQRLGWTPEERIRYGERNIVVMQKLLKPINLVG
jgi:GNAT superfamily N-acetyltransferase